MLFNMWRHQTPAETPPGSNQQTEQSQAPDPKRFIRPAAFAVAACAGLLAIGNVGWQKVDKSGQYVAFGPDRELVFLPTTERVNIIFWNGGGQLGRRCRQLQYLDRRYQPIAIGLQEGHGEDVEKIKKCLPDKKGLFVWGDNRQSITAEGQGGFLLSRSRLTDVKTRSLKGTPYLTTALRVAKGGTKDLFGTAVNTVKDRFSMSLKDAVGHIALGPIKDAANTTGHMPFKYAKQGMREYRASVAATARIPVRGTFLDVRLVTTHIGDKTDPKLHDEQLKEQVKYTHENNQPGRITILFGDLNATKQEVSRAFTPIGMKRPQDMDNYSTASGYHNRPKWGGHKIDHFVIYPGSRTLKNARVHTIRKFKTDHSPILLTMDVNLPGRV